MSLYQINIAYCQPDTQEIRQHIKQSAYMCLAQGMEYNDYVDTIAQAVLDGAPAGLYTMEGYEQLSDLYCKELDEAIIADVYG